MPTTIIVKEEAIHYESPERATLHINIELTGYDRERIHEQVSDVLRSLRNDIEQMHDSQNGPITWYAISGANTWSWKHQDGVKFTERVEVKVKFSNFTTLGEWLNSILSTDGIRLNTINWTLTERRKTELELQLRQKAVQLAREKAEQYASAVNLHVSAAKTIADAGLLGANRQNGASGSSVAASRTSNASVGGASGTDGYRFTPEDVLVTASIEAEFIAE